MNRPIRILHVFSSLNMGGAESRTMDIYRRIDREKVQFDFAVHTTEEAYYDKEVERLGGLIYNIPKYKIYNTYSYQKFWYEFLKNHSEFDTIHIHTTSIAAPILSVTKKLELKKVITHSRNAMQTGFLKNIYIKLSKKKIKDLSTHRLAVSNKAARYIYGDKLVDANGVHIVKNGINVSEFTYSEDVRNKTRELLGLTNETVIGHIGRFVEQKNHSFIIEIFKEFCTKNENARLVLIGVGPLEQVIREKVMELKLTDKVLFLGLRNDVTDLMQAMDLLLFPSLFEGLPGVILESQAAGLPALISSEISDEIKITDLVEMLDLSTTSSYWATKMKQMLESLTRINTRAELIDAGYDIESVAKWYEDFYFKAN